jgi:hypothetical protein
LFAVGCWLVAGGWWLLAVGCWLFAVGLHRTALAGELGRKLSPDKLEDAMDSMDKDGSGEKNVLF